MSDQDYRRAIAICIFILLALCFAGREDYRAAQVLEQPIRVVAR